MNDRPTMPTDSGVPAVGHAWRLGRAADAVAERILLLDRPKYVRQVPPNLNAAHGGLVLCDADAAAGVIALRKSGYTGVLVEDVAAYETEAATADEPFALPEPGLFGNDLESVLQEQLDRGATVALTPTRYVPAGASDALKAIMTTAQALDRDDVIVLVPVSIAWLRQESRSQLTSVLQRIPHPVALIFGGQYDPLRKFNAAPSNLRDLLQEVPGIGLWRTDLAGFDAMAHGGSFAAIGAGGSLRHLVPAGERPESSKPFPHFPTVLVPELLRFSAADFLADAYDDVTPPPCPCPLCGGGPLPVDSFYGLTDLIRAAAHQHNAALWNSWLPGLFESHQLGGRQTWWRNRCSAAVDAHLAENVRIRQPGKFKPPSALRQWASLPLRDTGRQSTSRQPSAQPTN
jgi:hypothetical protein